MRNCDKINFQLDCIRTGLGLESGLGLGLGL